MPQLTEVRWHGRGGQGAKTAGYVLAEAAAANGWQIQAFPEYGAERMGAPIKAYTRVSADPIEVHAPILEPDMVVVVNPNLLGVVDMTEGLKADGAIVFNTPDTPEVIRQKLGFYTGAVWCVDATKIAMSELRRDIPSTMLIAVIVRASGIVDLEAVVHLTRESLAGKLRPEVVEANVRALRRAYDECVQG